MKKKCEGQNVDIAVLKERVDNVEDFIKDLKENHLPHIYEELNKIKLHQAYYAGGVATIIIMAQLLIKFWK